MLGRILLNGELGKLASFVTPAFFDVMPSKLIWQQFKAFSAAKRDASVRANAMAERRMWLERSKLELQLRARGEAGGGKSARASDPAWRGFQVVALYFHQLLHGEVALLDLREQAFPARAEELVWQPEAWVVRWKEPFIVPLRSVYTGFYGNDDALFREGLRALSLDHAEDVFREHFGAGQGEVRFEVKHFVDSFHRVFMRCRQAGTSLHPDFLPLGLYLASLYDHLEQLAVVVDVAAAFELARELLPVEGGRKAESNGQS